MTKTEELMIAFPLIASLISDVHAKGVAEERERIYAYASDANCPYYRYDFTDAGFYLRASNLREFIKSGKEWVNPAHPASVLAPTKEGEK